MEENNFSELICQKNLPISYLPTFHLFTIPSSHFLSHLLPSTSILHFHEQTYNREMTRLGFYLQSEMFEKYATSLARPLCQAARFALCIPPFTGLICCLCTFQPGKKASRVNYLALSFSLLLPSGLMGGGGEWPPSVSTHWQTMWLRRWFGLAYTSIFCCLVCDVHTITLAFCKKYVIHCSWHCTV